MKDFSEILRSEIADYEGRHDDLIYQAPAFYRLLISLLDDPKLPGRLRPLVVSAIAYFILPADVIPEEIHGPYGYIDDIFLCALVAEEAARACGGFSIVEENWDGEGAAEEVVRDVLGREAELIGEKRAEILDYIGYRWIKEGGK